MPVGIDDILRAAPRGKRDTLLAKIRIITNRRDEAIRAKNQAIAEDAAAKNALGSGMVPKICFDEATEEAKDAADKLITACFDVGVKDDKLIADFVSHNFLRILQTQAEGGSRLDPPIPASYFMGYVQAYANEIPDRARSMRHDFQRAQGTRFRRILRELEEHPIVAYAVVASFIASQLWFWGERIIQLIRTVEPDP